jgi:hypothetical protein
MTSALLSSILHKRNSADRRSVLDMTMMIWYQRHACFHLLDWFDSLTTPLSADNITDLNFRNSFHLPTQHTFFTITYSFWFMTSGYFPTFVQTSLVYVFPRLRPITYTVSWSTAVSFWFIYEHLYVCQCLLVVSTRCQQNSWYFWYKIVDPKFWSFDPHNFLIQSIFGAPRLLSTYNRSVTDKESYANSRGNNWSYIEV